MSKIKYATYYYVGLAFIFIAPVLAVCFYFLSPSGSMMRYYSSVVLTVAWCIGVCSLVLSLAKYRMETGKTRAKKLLGALTPAQGILIAGENMLWIGLALKPLSPEGSEILILNAVFVMLLSAAIVALSVLKTTAKGNRCAHVKIAFDRANPFQITYGPSDCFKETGSPMQTSKGICSRCGKKCDQKLTTFFAHDLLCPECFAKIETAPCPPVQAAETVCSICKKKTVWNKVIVMNGETVCEECLRKR